MILRLTPNLWEPTLSRFRTVEQLEAALERARASDKSYLIAIDTDPMPSTDNHTWWDVAIAEVSERAEVRKARKGYEKAGEKQPY